MNFLDFINLLKINWIATFIAITLLGLVLFYGLLNFLLWKGLGHFHKNQPQKPTQSTSPLPESQILPSVSVLISARNEEKNILACLQSLAQQNYKGQWDVWIANDRSNDSTLDILNQFQSEFSKLNILNIHQCPPLQSPKKNAISQLIQKSTGEILLLTDADCIVGPHWISSQIEHFDSNTEMLLGFSHFNPLPNQILYKMQGLEFLSYAVASAGFVSLNFPMTSTGNNLAYRRSLWTQINGFEGVSHIMSGDDDLLLHKCAKYNPKIVNFNTDPNSFVQTQPQHTLKGFWEQRKRWASKTIYYTPSAVVILSSIFLFYATIAALFILGFWNPIYFLISIILWIWKTFWDGIVMIRGALLFKQPSLLSVYLPTALLHIPLIFFAVLFGLAGRFKWKT